MDEVDSLEALANLLTLLNENPYDLALHSQHVHLARETGLEDQLEAALDMVTTFWAAGDYVWLPLLNLKIKYIELDSAAGIKSVLELFDRAESDYLC
jgi:squamous cell carcinoma antigen recognized by T-cells 3